MYNSNRMYPCCLGPRIRWNYFLHCVVRAEVRSPRCLFDNIQRKCCDTEQQLTSGRGLFTSGQHQRELRHTSIRDTSRSPITLLSWILYYFMCLYVCMLLWTIAKPELSKAAFISVFNLLVVPTFIYLDIFEILQLYFCLISMFGE